VRLFVAINPPPHIRESVYDATASLRDAVPELRWIPAERLHVTVRFIGEQEDAMLPALRSALHEGVASSRSMDITFSGVSAFPSFRRARVVWLGIEYETRLELLHHDVESALMKAGLEVEGRAFRPHLTLARVPERLSRERARDLSQAARGIRHRTAFTLESLELMRSEAMPGGPRYSVVASAPLVKGSR
jgi:RNA 2',3'-cyclic 3'-phosphodiesterase